MWAYIIAKHFSISIKEVHEMTPQQFYQSLTWAMVGQEEEEKGREKSKARNKSAKGGSQEVVSVDYSNFLAMEEAGDF